MPSMTCGAARGASRGSSASGDQGQTSIPDYNGEVSLHSIDSSKTYVVYRPINESYATKMAQLMITACNNKNIGYSQNNRAGVWNHGVDSSVLTDADCSSLVSYCIYKATGKNIGMFDTSAEPSALMNSGLFTKVGTYTSGMVIYNGDVFCTPSRGHTYMAVQGNPRTGSDTELSGTVTDGGSTAYDTSTGGAGVTVASIDTSVLNQYIVTIDRNTKNPDYKSMLKNRVSGVVIEAGCLYTAQHTISSSVRNPYIQQQCKNAVSAKMPYGLYWTVRAKTVDEAKSELYELQFLIRKYPPVLGIWLKLSLTASKSTNNKIIDTYAQEFEILGLKGYKGFYVTKEELEKIDWDNYQEDWWLWIVNHVSSTSEVNKLLEPYFFTISGEPGSAAANPDYNAGSGTVVISSSGSSSSGTLSNSSGAHITIQQKNKYYLNAQHPSSGRLVIGNSRMVQLYAYNNYQYFSNSSFVAVWGGNYGGSSDWGINSSSRVSTMKSDITQAIQSTGGCKVCLETTVNEYGKSSIAIGADYKAPANRVANLAKTLSGVTATYNGKKVSPKIYVMSLIAEKGISVSNYNNYLKGLASSYNFTWLDISSCLGGDNGGYLKDNVHYNDTTLKNIWCNVVA